MKLAVSFSLSIPNPKAVTRYLEGFRRNVAAIPVIYPEADVILHHDDTVPADVVALADHAVHWDRREDLGCAYWRFTSINDPRYDAVLFRDADSVVGTRERNAVQQWLESPFALHTMRDNPGQTAKVMAGMWGAKRGAFPYDFNHLVRWWLANKGPHRYQSDEWFLHRYVYPYAERGGMNHCGGYTFSHVNPTEFPDGPSPNVGYVGERL